MEITPVYKRKNILVISGGGPKGLAGLGALTYLIQNEIIVFPEIFAGTSVGAVICFLLNIGYSPKDIYEILLEIDFIKLIKYIEPENLLIDPCFGLSSPEPILQVIYSFMKKKNIKKNITFKELFDMTKSKLIITGTCINDISISYFSIDTYPNMPILKAIRISISIPFIFRPYLFENKLWVDGGCMDNFPMELFIDKLDDVIGIYLDDHYEHVENIDEVQDYFYRIFKCMYRGLNCNKIKLYKKYCIHIICNCNYNADWDITNQDKQNLYKLGLEIAKKYVETNISKQD
jgi:NTE family protein